MVLFLDIIGLIGALLAVILSVIIYHWIGGKGRILTTLAFGWAFIVRCFTIVNDVAGTAYPSSPMQAGFWVLMNAGLFILVMELKSTLHTKNGKGRKRWQFWKR